MFRLVAIEVVLFLLPFAVYALVMAYRRRIAEVLPEDVAMPMVRLAIFGLVLMIASLIGLAVFEGDAPTGTYVPDRFENGRLVPGYIK